MEKTKSQQLLLQALNKENEELLMKVEVVTAENKCVYTYCCIYNSMYVYMDHI